MSNERLIITEQDKDEYIQWLKDTGRMKYKLTDIFVNDNGVIKTEKKMAWVAKVSTEDWKEFCNATSREYIGEVDLLALCQ
jgi:hypothetical protein